MDILSTKAVAEMLGVSEATVKRWSDAGTLRCFRTPGGHRKFRLRDVKSFLSDMGGDDGSPANPPPSPGLTADQRQARSLALAADVDGLVSLVASQRLRGASLAQTFDHILAPALHDIGTGWAAGRVLVAQEHIASNAVGEMLARVRPLVDRVARPSRGRALCACVADEHHDLAIRMAALVLTAEGYQASVIGANVPVHDLALLVAGERPALLALSASQTADPARLHRDLAIIASAAHAVRTETIVGGIGFANLALPAKVQRHTTFEEMVESRSGPPVPGAQSDGHAPQSLTEPPPDLS